MLGKTIGGLCTLVVVGTGVAVAIPESREWMLNKIAPWSEIYKEQKIELDASKKQAAEYLEKYNASQLELKTTKTALETKTAELETTKAELQAEKDKIIAINTEIDNATNRVKEIENSLQGYYIVIEDSPAVEPDVISNTTDKIMDFKLAVASLGHKTDLVKVNVDVLNTNIEDLNERIAILEQNAEDNLEEIARLQAQVNDLTTERNNLQTALTNAQNEVLQLTSRVSELETELETANARITELENQVGTLTNEKEQLQLQLANVENELSQALLKLAEYQKTVTLNLVNCTTEFNQDIVYLNEGFELTINASEGSTLPETINVTNAEYTWNKDTGILTITNVTGDVEIEIISEGVPQVLAAGLYDENDNLVESWDSLVSSGKINITDNTINRGTDTTLSGKLVLDSNVEILNESFRNCELLTEIVLPEGLSTFYGSPFNSCSSLKKINIPSSLTCSFSPSYFNGCYNLETITVSEDNPKYDSRDNCNAIIETETNKLIVACNNTTIPTSVTAIGRSAFRLCSKLNGVLEIPSQITYLDESVVQGFDVSSLIISSENFEDNSSCDLGFIQLFYLEFKLDVDNFKLYINTNNNLKEKIIYELQLTINSVKSNSSYTPIHGKVVTQVESDKAGYDLYMIIDGVSNLIESGIYNSSLDGPVGDFHMLLHELEMNKEMAQDMANSSGGNWEDYFDPMIHIEEGSSFVFNILSEYNNFITEINSYPNVDLINSMYLSEFFDIGQIDISEYTEQTSELEGYRHFVKQA